MSLNEHKEIDVFNLSDGISNIGDAFKQFIINTIVFFVKIFVFAFHSVLKNILVFSLSAILFSGFIFYMKNKVEKPLINKAIIKTNFLSDIKLELVINNVTKLIKDRDYSILKKNYNLDSNVVSNIVDIKLERENENIEEGLETYEILRPKDFVSSDLNDKKLSHYYYLYINSVGDFKNNERFINEVLNHVKSSTYSKKLKDKLAQLYSDEIKLNEKVITELASVINSESLKSNSKSGVNIISSPIGNGNVVAEIRKLTSRNQNLIMIKDLNSEIVSVVEEFTVTGTVKSFYEGVSYLVSLLFSAVLVNIIGVWKYTKE